MVSKELLSEVLGYKVLKAGKMFNEELLQFETETEHRRINIYSLAHKCKEWIASKYPRFSIKWDIGYVKGTNETVKVWLYNKCIGENRKEHKAIFKACQYILDNKDI